jgi:hypothetical protein
MIEPPAAGVAAQPQPPARPATRTRTWLPEELAELVTAHRFTYQHEGQLQDGLAAVFTAQGVVAEREVRLAGHDRIDFLVGRVGVEVKTRGQVAAVARQLQRYAGCDRIDALLLVTAVARHLTLPATIGGKPLLVASLLEGAL